MNVMHSVARKTGILYAPCYPLQAVLSIYLLVWVEKW